MFVRERSGGYPAGAPAVAPGFRAPDPDAPVWTDVGALTMPLKSVGARADLRSNRARARPVRVPQRPDGGIDSDGSKEVTHADSVGPGGPIGDGCEPLRDHREAPRRGPRDHRVLGGARPLTGGHA